MSLRTFDHNQRMYYSRVRGAPDGVFYGPYLPIANLKDAGGRWDSNLPDRNLVAIVDSGVAVQHPLLRPRIIAYRDFTGTGMEDRSGHGTMRALMALNAQPPARFLIAKVATASGGNRQALIDAVRWAIDQGAGMFYLALGEYNILCRGNCPLCRVAREAIEGQRVVIAAPGNRHSHISCPAKAKGVIWTTGGLQNAIKALVAFATVPTYYSYPGAVLPHSLSALGIALEVLGAEFNQAKESTELVEIVKEAREVLLSALKTLLPEFVIQDQTGKYLSTGIFARLFVIDEVWERVPEKLLVAMMEAGSALDPIGGESMWVPLGGIPRNFGFYATVPRDVPHAARYLITKWEYVWANIARLFLVLQTDGNYDYEWVVNQYEQIVAQLRRHLSANPDDADSLFQLGVLQLARGSTEEACESFQRASALRPCWPALDAACEQLSFQNDTTVASKIEQFRTASERDHAQALQLYEQAKKYVRIWSTSTIDQAIEGFIEALDIFKSLNEPLAICMVSNSLGAGLIIRTWIAPVFDDRACAAEAESVLSQTLGIVRAIDQNTTTRAIEANALAWRARARTLLAKNEPYKNDLALEDTLRALKIWVGLPPDSVSRHDLAVAHLHKARALFFRAVSGTFFRRLVGRRRLDLDGVHSQAAEALKLEPDDLYVSAEATWLLQKTQQ